VLWSGSVEKNKMWKVVNIKQLSSTGHFFIICGMIVVRADTESILLLIWFF